jgi:DNA mismatch repair ATPase MutL
MRAFRFLNLAMLAALVAGSAALYAQDENKPEDKPRQEEPKRAEEPKQQDEAKPAARQDEMKTPRQDEAKPSKQDKEEQKQKEKQEEKQPRSEMKTGQPEEHSRPAGKGAHIPDEKFRAQFGRGHTFVAQRPVIVEGQPRFQYSGYSFVLVDAWPADWTYTDDCYIDYIDGEYFLFDLRHPGVRIALFVVM